MYDIIIIGAGPSGLTAGIYARRSGKSVLVIDKGTIGGQMTFSPKIENFPAFEEISGTELADKILTQALSLGIELEIDTITGIDEEKDGRKLVHGKSGDYSASAVIIAVGATHRRLGIEGEDELIGNGISFCCVCDGAFYKGKDVLLIGGGNSAMQEALSLSDICNSVKMVQNLPVLTGEELLKEKIENTPNISVVYNSTVKSIISENETFKGIVISSEGGEERELFADGMFVAIGLKPENESFTSVAELDKYGYIASNEDCLTKTPGVFVAGDCRRKNIRQIATAVADGAVAALAACKYLR